MSVPSEDCRCPSVTAIVVADASVGAGIVASLQAQSFETLETVVATNVQESIARVTTDYLLVMSDGDELAPDALACMVSALEADAAADGVRIGFVVDNPADERVYVPILPADDSLLEALAGSPYPPPLCALMFRSGAARQLSSKGAWEEATKEWRAREVVATGALVGIRFLGLKHALARSASSLPMRAADQAAAGKRVFERLRATALGVTSDAVRPVHSLFLDQDWKLWRLSGRRVTAGVRTRSFGAVATVVGHVLSGLRGSDTLEGLTNRVRATVPRVTRNVLAVRGAIEALTDDGFFVEADA